MLAEGGKARAQIDCDIKNGSAEDAHQSSPRLHGLVVKPAVFGVNLLELCSIIAKYPHS
jgi:hypothetical protein